VLAAAGDQAWLRGLEQLQVLVLHVVSAAADSSCMSWVERCSREALPPRLRVLSVTQGQGWWLIRGDERAREATVRQVGRRLRQLLSGSACEVVVANLDEACDPVKQLAGVPVELQQALP
jgi:hypothetical protein